MPDRTPENVKVLKKQTLYKKFFEVDEYTFEYPLYNGRMSKPVCYEVMERGNAVGVLLYDPDREQIVFVEQFRVGVFFAGDSAPWLLECPAGIMDHKGEKPEDVAVREAKEETGAVVADLEPIASYYSSPGGISEKIHLFCGRVDSAHVAAYAGLVSENEDIRVVILSVADVEKMLAEGKFNNGLTIIALQWFMLNKEKIRQKWGGK